MAVRLSSTFVFRKLHQLTGILPLGVFLLEHLYTNSKAMTGAGRLQQRRPRPPVNPLRPLHRDRRHLHPAASTTRVYGLFITWEMRPNNLSYPYPRNWFYTIQRITGMILFFFITFHVLNFRFGLVPGLNEISVAEHPDRAFAIVSGEFKITGSSSSISSASPRPSGTWPTGSGCSRWTGASSSASAHSA